METLLFDKLTPVFWWVKDALETHDIVIEQGGTWSSKTYSIVQNMLLKAITEQGKIITIVGQDMPNLTGGALRDMKERILPISPQVQAAIVRVTEKPNVYYFKTGSIIEFKSYKDAQDAQNGKRDYLFLNEVMGIKEEICQELIDRSEKTVMDYNAHRSFWVHDKLFQKDNAIRHISNYTHNPYVPPNTKQNILSYKEKNPFRWRVLGLGLTGELKENLWLDSFSKRRHIQPVRYNPNEPVHISIDFNVGKFCAIAYQCSEVDNSPHSYFHVIDEFVLPSANIVEMAQKIRNKFGQAMLFVTGDQTGAKRDTGYSKSNDTTLQILQRQLGLGNRQMLFGSYNNRYASANPSHQNSWAHCNNTLSHHPNFKIAPHCKELINDCEIAIFVEGKNDFQLKKGDGAGKWAMNALDCMRYAIAAKCPSYMKTTSILTA